MISPELASILDMRVDIVFNALREFFSSGVHVRRLNMHHVELQRSEKCEASQSDLLLMSSLVDVPRIRSIGICLRTTEKIHYGPMPDNDWIFSLAGEKAFELRQNEMCCSIWHPQKLREICLSERCP